MNLPQKCTRMSRPRTTASWSNLQRAQKRIEGELTTTRKQVEEEVRILTMHLDRLQLLTCKSERLEKQLRLCAKSCRERLDYDEAAEHYKASNVDSSRTEADCEASAGSSATL